jgi:hypothetical protein
MEGSPPYLFGTDDHPGAGLRVTGDIDAAAIEITVRGRWSQRLGLDAYAVIRKCLTEQPSAIIVDLVGLDDPFAASATMWLAVNRTAGRLDPPARVVLCLPPATPLAGKLRRLGAARFVALFATMPQARAALRRDLPLTDRLQLLRLPPEPLSASAARNLVGLGCSTWNLPGLLHSGRSIISELVDNAAEHARTDMAVTVWRRGAGLHLSVRDGDPTLPELREPAPPAGGRPQDVRGQGLQIVDAVAAAWGAMATADGKLVWATLRAPHRQPSPAQP